MAGEGRGSLLVLVSHNSAAGSLITRNKLGRRKDGDWLLGERGDKSKKVLFSSLLNFKGFPHIHTHTLTQCSRGSIGMMGEPAFSLSPVPLQKASLRPSSSLLRSCKSLQKFTILWHEVEGGGRDLGKTCRKIILFSFSRSPIYGKKKKPGREKSQ